jgi:hypothetical protein
MPTKPRPEPTDTRSQAQKFIDRARELGCDQNEAVFDATLKRISPAKPEAGEINPKG